MWQLDKQQQPTVLAETAFLRLVQAGHWTYAQRPRISGAIAIVAVTERHELILVDQYRIPVAGRVIELPAGLVGDVPGQESESWETAARRELLEEVGFTAERVEVLTSGVSSAGLTDEAIQLVWAEGLRQVTQGGGDGTEDIVVQLVPIDEVLAWLRAQQQAGKQVDYKVFAGLYFAELRRAQVAARGSCRAAYGSETVHGTGNDRDAV